MADNKVLDIDFSFKILFIAAVKIIIYTGTAAVFSFISIPSGKVLFIF